MKDRTTIGIGAEEHILDWSLLDWRATEKKVKNLRRRIYRATQECEWNKVRSLTKLMIRSYSNLLLSVRRVTQDNPGKKTPGVDQRVALTPRKREKLVKQMIEHKLWKVNPARRVYIPKVGGQRPLGIPTISNRVAQAVLKNALEPCWEARFESNSYGFRPGRSAHDAVQHAWIRLNAWGRDKWVLDADIKGAFDNISHDCILGAVKFFPGRKLIKAWLKAGYVEESILHQTESGVPQGSVIGPLLANIALDGIQDLIGPKYGFIRYCDDFIVTAKTKEMIEEVKPTIEKWLRDRGLEMHPRKTQIVSVEDGFNFLGFTIKHFGGKCIVKPQKEKTLSFLKSIQQWLSSHKQSQPEFVIRHLNPRLKGWANYYIHACSKKTFQYVDSRLWKMLWKWSLRRHPEKGKFWVRRKYFRHQKGRNWRFSAVVKVLHDDARIFFVTDVTRIPIRRHIKVRGAVSPDDPKLIEYWTKRISNRRKFDMQGSGSYAF